tara:strand:- start:2755 stop:3024 length:270 start_codon:yes stop_codon:yes gene_type:complete
MEKIKEQTFINKGFCTNEEVFKGLEEHPDGTIVLWNDIIYWITSHKRLTDGVRALGLEEKGKFNRPKRNEPCWCGSEKKYKKCCWKYTG